MSDVRVYVYGKISLGYSSSMFYRKLHAKSYFDRNLCYLKYFLIFQVLSIGKKEFFFLFIYGILLLVEKFFPFSDAVRREVLGVN